MYRVCWAERPTRGPCSLFSCTAAAWEFGSMPSSQLPTLSPPGAILPGSKFPKTWVYRVIASVIFILPRGSTENYSSCSEFAVSLYFYFCKWLFIAAAPAVNLTSSRDVKN